MGLESSRYPRPRQSLPAPRIPEKGCSLLPQESVALWGGIGPEGHFFSAHKGASCPSVGVEFSILFSLAVIG